MQSIQGGRFILRTYMAKLDFESDEGAAIIGFNLSQEVCQMAWADTFHNGTGIMLSSASKSNRAFNVVGFCLVPEGPR